MKLLLDTVAFIWFVDEDPRLSAAASSAIVHPNSQVFLSSASAWEIVIKYGKGHILLSDSPHRYITINRQRHRIDSLPIDEHVTLNVLQLPDIHRDPFDRIIIAQAIANNMLIVTPDNQITRYPVSVIW